jgi:Acetyltransferase (GNAT) domain
VSLSLSPFDSVNSAEWDGLVARSVAGTFLHSRRFLSYHGERFRDLSVCIYDAGLLVAVLPAASDPLEPDCVTSHPGASYGGLIHDGGLRGSATIEAFEAIRGYYRQLGLARLRYKAVPRIYQQVPAEDDLYSLFRLGARRYRCDLAAVIELPRRMATSRRRKRCFKAAMEKGVVVAETPQVLSTFWSLLENTLGSRHQAQPIHTYEEILLLQSRFSGQIHLTIALAGEELLGGVVLFIMPTTVHVQYNCASERGFSLHALDAVFEHCIAGATQAGAKWFSMGISNEDDGRVLNDSLYRFKTEFGAGGVAHEFYELDLR